MALLVVVAAAFLAGCGGSSSGGSGSDETVISTREEEQTLVLVNDADYTLYTFSGDSCEGECAKVWPPMVAKGQVKAESDSGLDPDLLGKTERADGTSQVTYEDKPLYLYSKDGAGQTTGTGTSFGGNWRAATTTASFERQTTTGVSCEPNCDY